jgi:hypothetical protein
MDNDRLYHRMEEERAAYEDWFQEQWEKYATANGLPIELCEPEHEAYVIYTAWENLFTLTERYSAHIYMEELRESEWKS